MKKALLASVAVILGAWVSPVSAQRYYQRPATSPYSGPGVTYNRLFYGSSFGPVGAAPGAPAFGLSGVTNAPITGAFANRSWTSSGETDPSIPGALVTGHPTRFFHYQHYFNNQGGSGSSPVPLAGGVQPGTANLPFGITGTRPGSAEVGKRPNVSKRN